MTPPDTIHNLCVVIDALINDTRHGLVEWEDCTHRPDRASTHRLRFKADWRGAKVDVLFSWPRSAEFPRRYNVSLFLERDGDKIMVPQCLEDQLEDRLQELRRVTILHCDPGRYRLDVILSSLAREVSPFK